MHPNCYVVMIHQLHWHKSIVPKLAKRHVTNSPSADIQHWKSSKMVNSLPNITDPVKQVRVTVKKNIKWCANEFVCVCVFCCSYLIVKRHRKNYTQTWIDVFSRNSRCFNTTERNKMVSAEYHIDSLHKDTQANIWIHSSLNPFLYLPFRFVRFVS